jgi:hypothetical protein
VKVRVLAAALLGLIAFAGSARADDAIRVVIAGPKKDPIATRLEKELVALGYAPVAVGALECTEANVANAVENAGASAALCSNHGRVAVWTDDGTSLKLRDTVVAKDDTIALQATEVMRANIAFREPEPVPVDPAKPPPPPPPSTGAWDDFENEDRPVAPPKKSPPFAPLFTASAGASYLMGRAASLGGLSLDTSVRVHSRLSLVAHVDAPLSGTRAEPMSTVTPPDGSKVRVTPGIAGVGVVVPFTDASSIVVPRLGGSLGVAWIHATKTPGALRDQFGSLISTTKEVGDGTVAPAGWLSVAFSFRVAGPMRLVADGLLGSTAGGIAIRNQHVLISRWGVPFAAAGLRAEVMLP